MKAEESQPKGERGKKKENTDEESFARSYLHISNAKHLEFRQLRRDKPNAAAVTGEAGTSRA